MPHLLLPNKQKITPAALQLENKQQQQQAALFIRCNST
jgi:hypothetical protein